MRLDQANPANHFAASTFPSSHAQPITNSQAPRSLTVDTSVAKGGRLMGIARQNPLLGWEAHHSTDFIRSHHQATPRKFTNGTKEISIAIKAKPAQAGCCGWRAPFRSESNGSRSREFVRQGTSTSRKKPVGTSSGILTGGRSA